MPRRRKDKVDSNQAGIVADLRKIPGVTVEVDHDDILVGCMDRNHVPRTYWYEIKAPDQVSKKTGNVLQSALKDSQKELIKKWTGHYKVVTSLDEILKDIGVL